MNNIVSISIQGENPSVRAGVCANPVCLDHSHDIVVAESVKCGLEKTGLVPNECATEFLHWSGVRDVALAAAGNQQLDAELFVALEECHPRASFCCSPCSNNAGSTSSNDNKRFGLFSHE